MKRKAEIDNLKAFLIFMVVLGHCFEFLCGKKGVYGTLRAAIYSFHMPAFVFVSGYLSRYSKKTLPQLTVIYLSTYLIFNTLYALSPWHISPRINIFLPQIVYWYLLSLLFWRIGVPALSGIRFILPLSVMLAVYAGVLPQADRFLSISRTICFLPFFLAGCTIPAERIRHMNKALSAVILLGCMGVTLLLNLTGIIPVKMYTFLQSYGSSGVKNLNGMAMRSVMLLLAFVMVACLISLAPSGTYRWSICGKNTMVIYLLHMFPIKVFGSLFKLQAKNHSLNIVICILLSAVITAALSAPVLSRLYNRMTGRIVKFFLPDQRASIMPRMFR